MPAIIETNNLRKTFSSGPTAVEAVKGVDLVVNEGEIFGFLGPNGAGKTTTMRMLTTLLRPTSGTAMIAGYDLMTQEEKVRMHIGYVSQSGGLERGTSARENLELQARIFHFNKQDAQARADELIKAFGIESFADRDVETYSGGQRRKADIACGMVHRPKLLFLDEPTVGLDPQSRIQVWEQMKKLRSQRTTIFFTTHYLDEADLLCDRVAIVDQGKIVALDTPHALKAQIGNDVIVIGMFAQDLERLVPQDLFAHLSGIREIIKEKDTVRFLVNNGEELLLQILRACDKAGIVLTTVNLHRPTLDDVFLQKAGHSFKQNQGAQ